MRAFSALDDRLGQDAGIDSMNLRQNKPKGETRSKPMKPENGHGKTTLRQLCARGDRLGH
jgi:hypothetical protein